ncbi:hypothetical protein FGF01_13270 [Aeromonas salmonicida subsp. achromogenes]|nr:hypothetical protein CE456_19350 [Aeromonas salmonicida]ATD40233.1 hypothetical protein BHG40_21595 [Aeromonas salmonicida subsp. masoucida]AYO62224.1 hypothetical protein C5P03_04885 [Aeromonas salmonicida subsp. salmonicida 01-B526]KIX25985.1 hypothetical protein TM02_05835 [Aeromonas salmonicida subsp. salmonicida]TMX07335.1 hypothetical protein FGE99_19365 [Aeromonas salmonicida subsp. achromogenes]
MQEGDLPRRDLISDSSPWDPPASRGRLLLMILDQAQSQRPGFCIFVGSKAPRHEIADGLPQFETRPL